MRKSSNGLYFSDEVLQRAFEDRFLGIWEFIDVFFPRRTNRKQFDCALTLMRKLLESGSVESTSLKALVGSDYATITTIVIPKLEKFGLVKTTGDRGKGKTYAIELEKTFTERLFQFALGWFRIYAKYGDKDGW